MDIAKIEIFGLKIKIAYVDGSREDIQAGRYTLRDAEGDRVERRTATDEDRTRLQALADAFVTASLPGEDVAITSHTQTATELQVRYVDGRAESVELGVYQIKNAQNDTIFETTATQAHTDRLLALIDDFLNGDQPGAILTGTIGDDRIDGGNGSDDISGQDGEDDLRGEGGDDTILGGAGDDRLRGSAGNDSLSGEDGDDRLRGDGDIPVGGVAGDDLLFGGAGVDRLVGEAGNDVVYGDAGDDLVRGDMDNDAVYGGDGNDRARGDGGDDSVWGDAGDDRVDGGLGNDTLYGGADNDRVKGDAGDDMVMGDDGDDRVDGDAGNDMLAGGAGDDDLHGGLDNDSLDGNTGSDIYHGDLGADVFVFAADAAFDKVDDFQDGIDLFDLSAYGFADLAAVLAGATEHVDANGTDVFLDFGGGDILKLDDVTLAQLTEADFLL
jgi:serralysin